MAQLRHSIYASLIKHSVLFSAAFILCALIGIMTVSDISFAPVAPDYSAVSPLGAIEAFSSAARNPALELLLIFISSRSAYLRTVSGCVSVWRGASLGYTAALISNGRLIMDEEYCISGIRCPKYIPTIAAYIIVSIMLMIFSSVMQAVTHSGYAERFRWLRLFVLMLLLCGFAAIVSFLGSLCI